MVENVIIVGAAGRDFHNFNVYFRDNARYRVVAFTAAQIPNIEGRIYPPGLAGSLYPDGIPIHPEAQMAQLIRDHHVDLVAFSYSDVSHVDVMHKASVAMAEGADFILLGATYTMLKAKKPVIAVCAVRTGCGKSQTTREICRILKKLSKRVVVVRHPMPYGDLTRQTVQRFCCYEDFERHQCTIEEREEYEPLVEQGIIVYGGIDYAKVLQQAEAEADVLVWDGGNNDTPFFQPDVHIVLFDPHRAGHELLYYPGETNMIMADVAIINKVDTASGADIEKVIGNIQRYAPEAEIVLAASPVSVDRPEQVSGKRVLVIEDGPTLTHGGMTLGAATVAARKFGAAEIVDPRPYAAGSIREAFETYPHLGAQLPAVGYSETQRRDLERTVNAVDCDLVLIATPVNLAEIIHIDKPSMRVRYEYQDYASPRLEEVLMRWAHVLMIETR
ncbi:MAG: cyclic 2,3-diphosphoglycerate synthase [Syntrophobacteraceae bacterium]